jgi:hypothetical protein
VTVCRRAFKAGDRRVEVVRANTPLHTNEVYLLAGSLARRHRQARLEKYVCCSTACLPIVHV